MTRSSGCRGGRHHEALVDMIRFDVQSILLHRFGDRAHAVSSDTIFAMWQMGNGRKGKLFPDVAFWLDGEGMILVEVGDFTPSKFPPLQSVIHVGFNHRVSRVNPQGLSLEPILVDCIEYQLETGNHRIMPWIEQGFDGLYHRKGDMDAWATKG